MADPVGAASNTLFEILENWNTQLSHINFEDLEADE